MPLWNAASPTLQTPYGMRLGRFPFHSGVQNPTSTVVPVGYHVPTWQEGNGSTVAGAVSQRWVSAARILYGAQALTTAIFRHPSVRRLRVPNGWALRDAGGGANLSRHSNVL